MFLRKCSHEKVRSNPLHLRRRGDRLIDRFIRMRGADENRFEGEQFDFFSRVYNKYREIAAREPVRVVTIEGDLSIDEVHEKSVEAVAALLILPALALPE